MHYSSFETSGLTKGGVYKPRRHLRGRWLVQMSTLFNKTYFVKVFTLGGGSQNCPKFCLRGLQTPPRWLDDDYSTQWSIWTSHPKYVCFHEKLEFKLLTVLVNYNNGIEIVYRTKFHDFLNFCIQSVKLRVLYNDLFCFFKTPYTLYK